MKRKLVMISLILIFMFMSFYTTTSYAAFVTVTQTNLTEALQDLQESSVNTENFQIQATDQQFQITEGGQSATVQYRLNNQPTFTTTVEVRQGMTYSEYEKEMSNLMAPLYGHMAVARVQGISYQDF